MIPMLVIGIGKWIALIVGIWLTVGFILIALELRELAKEKKRYGKLNVREGAEQICERRYKVVGGRGRHDPGRIGQGGIHA